MSAALPKTPLRRKSHAPENILGTNDDEVEKENLRRQHEQQNAPMFTPFKNVSADKRKSFDALGGTPKGGRLDAQGLQELYGNCIKLANDNKITQKNAWQMTLLDHMRGLATSQETDFVTAGCTLDAAGKIYSCRVDSVHTETFRVVTGLSRSSQPNENEEKPEEDGEEKEEQDPDSEDDDGNKKKKKKEKRVVERSSTIEANPENLVQKKVETECTSDPLFQKMCQAFDEGGARGMLLNQLSAAPGCKLLIDSEAVTDDSVATVVCNQAELFGLLEIANDDELKSSLLQRQACIRILTMSCAVCPNVCRMLGISSKKDIDECFDSLQALPPPPAPSSLPSTSGRVEAQQTHTDNHTEGADDVDDEGDDDDQGGMDAMDDGHADEMEERMMAEIGDDHEGDDADDAGPTIPLAVNMQKGNKTGRPSLSGDINELDHFMDFNDDYSYFNSIAVRDWSGPAHWKFRQFAPKARRDDEEGEDGEEGEEGSTRPEAAEKGRKGKGKKMFALDLTGPPPADLQKKLSPGTASTLLASAKSLPASSTANTLPPDLHYQPDKLFRLFLRPKGIMCARKNEGGIDADDDGEDDIGFGFGAGDDEGEEGNGETNFDYGGFQPSGVEGAAAAGDVVLLQQPRRAQKIQIDYAKTAKKIDIKMLKENLWSNLEGNMGDDRKKAQGIPAEGEAVSFSEIMAKVPGQKFPEVSVSFCFICLLHLANEKSLALYGTEQQRNGMESTLCAGSLSDLLVMSDP